MKLSKKQIDEIRCSDVHSAMLILIISEDILILQNLTNPILRWYILHERHIQKICNKNLRKLLNKYDSAHESDNNNTYQTLENSGRISFEEIQLP